MMNTNLNSRLLTLIVLIVFQNFLSFGQEIVTDVNNYSENEEIIITFSDGPGNPKDWVGIYKPEMVAGEDSSLAWLYVNGSEVSGEGAVDGELVFFEGLVEEGIYEARFFENDSYTLLAKSTFTVGDIGPDIKTDKEAYMPGEIIVADFLVGPANPKDWVGLYKVDMVPGEVGSLAWFYVDGTKDGAEGVSTGTVTFDSGMTDVGEYKAVFLEDDGYTILAESLFKVQKPAPNTPKVVSISPADGEKNADPAIEFLAVIQNGGTALKNESVALSLDGKDVDVVITKDEDGFNIISYIGDGLFEASSSHKFQLEFSDDGDLVTSELVTVDFDVASYLQIDMPDPIHFESFNLTEEFELPEDWEVINLSQEINSELDPDDFTSAYYEGWVNVGMSRWSNSGSWAEKSIVSDPPVFVNGVRQSLDGNALVADSASRNGHFISFLFTKDYDLSNNQDVHLGFYSHYAQNQDSSGSIEYSIDLGESWLPVIYMIDRDDIINDDLGNVDAIATFEQEHEDIAIGYHPDTFEEIGGFYGAYIASDISDELAPYISGRINDDQTGSKRYETFRLPEADGQKNVRFRFAKSGTYSWYWGIDNFGLYSIAPSSMPEVVEASPVDGSQGVNPMPLMKFIVKNGEAKLDSDSVKLMFNDVEVIGVSVTEVKIGVEDGYQVSYQVNELLEPLSNNTFKLTFNEDSGERREGTYSGNFTIGDFKNLKLPEPIAFESFDDLDEFSLPEGWVVKSYVNEADTIVWEEDPEDWTSMSYSGWANISLDRWKTSPYWNEKSQNSIPPVFVNGKSQFPDGNFLIADSSLRNANFVTVIETKDFDISRHANIHLGFYSHYCQNQDNSASVEYSIDGGENWLPVIYMLDEADIVVGDDGAVDAVSTFEQEQGDVAIVDNILFQDEDEYWDIEPLDAPIGGNYGAFIRSDIDASLAPHVSARADDNQGESKRYELHSLPQANNQSSVRIRFAMNGTWSWYWSVDNFGLYSISEAPVNIPVIESISQDGGLVTINWIGEVGVRLQKAVRLASPDWVDVPNTEGESFATEVADQSERYYRLIRD